MSWLPSLCLAAKGINLALSGPGMHSSYPHTLCQQQIYNSWPSTPTLLAAHVLENTTQEKEFNVVSSKQFRRQEGMFSLPRDKPCDTNFSVVLLQIKDRNVPHRTFYIYILLGGFLCRYAKVRVNINVTPQVKECCV